jgi:hypothetical protein
MNSIFILKEVKMDIVNLYSIKRIKKKGNLNDFGFQTRFSTRHYRNTKDE